MELKERSKLIQDSLERFLPTDFITSNEIILNSLEDELKNIAFEYDSFIYMPIADYIAYNYSDFDLAIESLKEITKRFTSEFAIRVLIKKEPQKSFEAINRFVLDSNEHIRRLASEGIRIALPWAEKVKYLDDNLDKIIQVLSFLKFDSSKYVQKSVANNLNDISKVSPNLVIDTLRAWQKEGEIDWIKRHSLRSLIKSCNRDALEFLGFSDSKVKLLSFHSDSNVKLGESLNFIFELEALEDTDILIDFVIYFVKKSDKLSKKVFKLTTKKLNAKERLKISKDFSFKPISTRVYYIGLHKIELLINGESYIIKDFELLG